MSSEIASSESSSSESAAASAPSTFYVGIDVSKATLDVVILAPEDAAPADAVSADATPADAASAGSELSPVHTVPNTEAGLEQIRAALLARGGTPDGAHACLEASGGYEREVLAGLHKQGWTVSLVNPSRTDAYRRVQLRRHKSDPADAQLLARFAQTQRVRPWEPPDAARADLQEVNRALDALKKERARVRVQRQRARHAGVQAAYDEVIATLDRQIEELKHQLDTAVEASKDLAEERALLETIPGIGRTAATSVLAELGDPDRFPGARQAAAYAGLTPAHHTSGTSVHKRPRMSKIGSRRLRKALYFPALTALQHNRAIEALGDRLARRGKAKMVIVGAAMRKLLHICYGVLTTRTPFDASLHPGT